MKKKKGKLIILLATLASMCFFAGCKFEKSLEEIRQEENLVAQVTYYANGGIFETKEFKKSLYYHEGDMVFEITEDSKTVSGTITMERADYKFLDWYEVVLENGKPKFIDEKKGIVELDKTKPVDFTKRITDGEHWIIGADWKEYAKVNAVLVCDGTQKSITTAEDVTYNEGDVVATYSFSSGNRLLSEAPIKAKDDSHTFLAFYSNAECEKEDLITSAVTAQEEDVTVYVKYLQGSWNVVKTKLEFLEIFKNTDTPKNFYLFNDIDCTDVIVNPLTAYVSKLQGNGYTISNLTVQQTGMTQGATPNVSMFGKIKSGAAIKDVSFTNLTVKFTGRNASDIFEGIYFVFTELENNALISNVKLQGTMTVGLPGSSVASNLWNGTDWIKTNCLYGGYATDTAYITATNGTGFTVEGDPEVFVKITK